jgi:tRNA wybutosine-synthesizing protein 1
MVEPENYAKLIKIANPMYVECKAYMHVGFSRRRLPHEEMPLHSEIEDFAAKLSEELGYDVKDRKEDSRVVLLSRS